MAHQINSRLLKFSKCFNVAQSWYECCLSVIQLASQCGAECVSSGSKLFTNGTSVVLGWLRVNGIIYNYLAVLLTNAIIWTSLFVALSTLLWCMFCMIFTIKYITLLENLFSFIYTPAFLGPFTVSWHAT